MTKETRQCLTCNGVYDTITNDGATYFHVCPPVAGVNAKRGGKPMTIALDALLPTDVISVQRGDSVVEIANADQQPGDQRIGDVVMERPNRRDETPTPATVDGKDDFVPRAEGKGFTKLAKR